MKNKTDSREKSKTDSREKSIGSESLPVSRTESLSIILPLWIMDFFDQTQSTCHTHPDVVNR